MSAADPAELTRLISGLFDQQLTAEQRARLELLLESDPDARRLYFQMVDQELELECRLGPVHLAPAHTLAPERLSHGPRIVWRIALAAAAAIALLFLLWPKHEPSPASRSISPIAAVGAWQEDFEGGALGDWSGELVSANLPPPGRFAIRATVTADPDGPIYRLASPENWRAGLVALTESSTLHITYRFASETSWINVFIHTMTPDGASPSMFQLKAQQFPGAHNQWQTATIPFRLFQRKIPDPITGAPVFIGGGPVAGEHLAALVISAPHPIDLIIDRIWVTPTGPTQELIEPLR
jgi:hypothetical protein